MIFYSLLFVCFIITLFLLFTISKNDFILLRKNITQTQLFDKILLIFLGQVIAGRIVFIINESSYNLLNPLRFFHFILDPGFSLFGGYVAGIILIAVSFRDKMSVPRIADITYLSYTPFFIFSIFYIFSTNFIIDIAVSCILVAVFAFFIYLHKNYIIKDGSIFAIITITISLTFFITEFRSQNNMILYFSFMQMLYLLSIFSSLAYLIFNEKLLRFKK